MSPEEGGEFVKMLRAVFSTIAVRSSIHAGYQCILCIAIMAETSVLIAICHTVIVASAPGCFKYRSVLFLMAQL